MEPPHEDLRCLALWLARRRAVDEVVAQLTHYGPAATERVHQHLSALRQLLALETEAFVVLESSAPIVPQLPLPAALSGGGGGGTVISLNAARSRRQHS